MKAQFVSENMDFERGVDPKKTMGVGMLNKDISDYNKKQLEDYFIDILPLLFPDVKDFRELLLNRADGYLNSKSTDIVFNFSENKLIDYKFIRTFNPYKLYSDYIRGLYPDDVFENLDFERGQEPKDALQVGKKYKDIKPGDIVDVYYDLDFENDELSQGDYVKVKAISGLVKHGLISEFDGIIIDPKVEEQWWSVIWDPGRKDWTIQ